MRRLSTLRIDYFDIDISFSFQHTHDYFVISSCQVSCKLMRGDDLQSGESTTIKSAALETLKVPKVRREEAVVLSVRYFVFIHTF